MGEGVAVGRCESVGRCEQEQEELAAVPLHRLARSARHEARTIVRSMASGRGEFGLLPSDFQVAFARFVAALAAAAYTTGEADGFAEAFANRAAQRYFGGQKWTG